MFYGLNGPPEIDAVLMSSDSRKRGKNVSVLSVCICVPAWEICVRVRACPFVSVAARVCDSNGLK